MQNAVDAALNAFGKTSSILQGIRDDKRRSELQGREDVEYQQRQEDRTRNLGLQDLQNKQLQEDRALKLGRDAVNDERDTTKFNLGVKNDAAVSEQRDFEFKQKQEEVAHKDAMKLFGQVIVNAKAGIKPTEEQRLFMQQTVPELAAMQEDQLVNLQAAADKLASGIASGNFSNRREILQAGNLLYESQINRGSGGTKKWMDNFMPGPGIRGADGSHVPTLVFSLGVQREDGTVEHGVPMTEDRGTGPDSPVKQVPIQAIISDLARRKIAIDALVETYRVMGGDKNLLRTSAEEDDIALKRDADLNKAKGDQAESAAKIRKDNSASAVSEFELRNLKSGKSKDGGRGDAKEKIDELRLEIMNEYRRTGKIDQAGRDILSLKPGENYDDIAAKLVAADLRAPSDPAAKAQAVHAIAKNLRELFRGESSPGASLPDAGLVNSSKNPTGGEIETLAPVFGVVLGQMNAGAVSKAEGLLKIKEMAKADRAGIDPATGDLYILRGKETFTYKVK